MQRVGIWSLSRPFRVLTLVLFTIPSSLVASSVSAESLRDYADACFKATGVDVPSFDCDDPASTFVPTTHAFDRNGNLLSVTESADFVALYAKLRANSGGRCDRPDQLNQECDPGSRFRVLVNTPDAFVVAHCRTIRPRPLVGTIHRDEKGCRRRGAESSTATWS